VTGDDSPPFLAEIGIRGGRIVEVGRVSVPDGTPILRARGRFVSPGFIDMHTHAEDGLTDIPTADNYLLQGVTTVVGGNCGMSHHPFSQLVSILEDRGTAINFAGLIGHNSIRAVVMGRKIATPSPRELRLMKERIVADMRSGAFGLSSGLTYFPGRHTTMKELIELASIVGRYGGLYATHMRSEGRDIVLALEEALRIGEKAGVRVHISHLKLFDEDVWGKIHIITDFLEKARSRGVEISADQYPYTASSTGYIALVPQSHRTVLRSRSTTSTLYLDLRDRLSRVFLNDLDRFFVGTHPPNPSFEGKNFVELLRMEGRDINSRSAAELLISMLRRGPATGIFFFMQEDDVEAIMRLPELMIASDGGVIEFGEGSPHCRSYGTFPRIFARYVRAKQVLTVEDAVRKMTSLPAATLGLKDRGLIKPGFWADLVVFDPETIRDTATYSDPHQYPEGIALVLVNGRLAASEGSPTGVLAGRVLYGPGRSRPNSE
jgi:N-acyl-D-amino-acid deacylase